MKWMISGSQPMGGEPPGSQNTPLHLENLISSALKNKGLRTKILWINFNNRCGEQGIAWLATVKSHIGWKPVAEVQYD